MMGNGFKNLNRFYEAIECYDKSIQIESKNSDAYYSFI